VRYCACLALLCAALAAHAQSGFDEDQDFSVPPSAELRLRDHATPTPREIPGARTVRTSELRRALQAGTHEERPLLFDVLGGEGHATLPGAIWIPGAGRGTSFDDALQEHLGKFLEFVTRGDRGRALVFYCTGPRCWLSYNTALRAARLGYTNVQWYRGGIEAWGASGGALIEPRVIWRRPPLEG
jgi:PQQ-dependent catabolism-associated CXXCW motif protein